MLSFRSALAVGLVCGLTACAQNPAAPTTVTPVQPGPTVSGPIILEGAIESIAPPDTIVVRGQVVKLKPDARILSVDVPVAFTDLKVGMRVNVTAETDGTTPLMGTIVKVLDPIGQPTASR